jgi:hypothetical protein
MCAKNGRKVTWCYQPHYNSSSFLSQVCGFWVPGLGVSLALWCNGSLSAMDFQFVSQKKKEKETVIL